VSGPDEYSNLRGRELVRKKVNKLVSMAGEFPSGHEYNVRRDSRSAKHVFEEWPTPIIFSGFEIGERVNTGGKIVQNGNIQESPIRDVYRMKVNKGRSSFDHTAVLVGVLGHEQFYSLISGQIDIKWDGSNGWNSDKKGHYYLDEKMPVEEVESTIDSLMMVEP
jgi:inosine-uridine nucleoside N-ribohydrolase